MAFSANKAQTAFDASLEVVNDRAVELEKYWNIKFHKNFDEILDSGLSVFDLFSKKVKEDKMHKLSNFSQTKSSNFHDELKN